MKKKIKTIVKCQMCGADYEMEKKCPNAKQHAGLRKRLDEWWEKKGYTRNSEGRMQHYDGTVVPQSSGGGGCCG